MRQTPAERVDPSQLPVEPLLPGTQATEVSIEFRLITSLEDHFPATLVRSGASGGPCP